MLKLYHFITLSYKREGNAVFLFAEKVYKVRFLKAAVKNENKI